MSEEGREDEGIERRIKGGGKDGRKDGERISEGKEESTERREEGRICCFDVVNIRLLYLKKLLDCDLIINCYSY